MASVKVNFRITIDFPTMMLDYWKSVLFNTKMLKYNVLEKIVNSFINYDENYSYNSEVFFRRLIMLETMV